MPELMPVHEALSRMLQRFLPVTTSTIPLERALGRVLAQEIIADIDLPHFSNSGMDGFIVRAEDTLKATPDSPARLAVVMDIPAGRAPSLPLLAGQAGRIMTGAVIPEGSDAVIPIEDLDLPKNITTLPSEILVKKTVKSGSFIRPKGQDIKNGERILPAGKTLQPQDIGILASLGISAVPVFRPPKVAILSSGDELISPTQPLALGKIRDSNSYMLAGLVERCGAEVVRLGVVPDNPDLIRERLEIAMDRSVDLILTSAGVSVGAFDYVRKVIEENGTLAFWRVNIRPGKPIAFGSFRGIPIIGLPGNPVSAFVGFQVFIHPVIDRLSGRETRRTILSVELAEAITSDGRESYLRANLTKKYGKITAALAGHQGSGNMVSLVNANSLLIIPAGVQSLPIGAEVTAWLLDDVILTS